MPQAKIVKLIFYFAALLLAAKPFLGFGLFGHINSSVQTNIFVKVFNKRKLESKETIYADVQQLLNKPAGNLLLRFSYLLSILFPFAFSPIKAATARALRQILLGLFPPRLTLLTGQLLI